MTVAMIRWDDPVRAAFSGCSSGNGPNRYYETVNDALRAFDAALAECGYHLDCADNSAWSNDEGRNTVSIFDEDANDVGYAVIYYYRMVSGRYEFVAYIA